MGSPDQEYAPGISMDKLGENIYFSNHEGQILEYDLTENRSKVLFETNSSALKLLISKDGKFLVAGSKCGECTFYNLKNNQFRKFLMIIAVLFFRFLWTRELTSSLVAD